MRSTLNLSCKHFHKFSIVAKTSAMMSSAIMISSFVFLMPTQLAIADDMLIQHECMDMEWVVTITDSEGNPLKDVRVGTIKKMSSTSIEESFFTNEFGFVSLPESSYTGFVKISKGGYNDQKILLGCVFVLDPTLPETASNEITATEDVSATEDVPKTNNLALITHDKHQDCDIQHGFDNIIKTAQKLFSSEEYESAIACYENALELKPEYLFGLVKTAQSYYYLEQHQNALEIYDKIFKINPNFDLLFELQLNAGWLHQDEKFEEEILYLDKILEIEPSDSSAIFSKANILEKLGRSEEMLKHLEKYAKKNPENHHLADLTKDMRKLYYADDVNSSRSSEGYYYLSSGDKLVREPTICAFEIFDLQFPEAGKILLETTENSIHDWENKLKMHSNNTDAWNLSYRIIALEDQKDFSKPTCDITIQYQQSPPENLQKYTGAARYLDDGYASVWIYYVESVNHDSPLDSLRNTPISSDIAFISNSSKMLSSNELEKIIKHELGHAFGLGHVPKTLIEVNESGGNKTSSYSIMVSLYSKPSPLNSVQEEITPYDVNALVSLYGDDGFVDDTFPSDDGFVDDIASDGGCLIATAAYGTELAPQVQFLREVRDNTVLSTASGTAFMTGFNTIYYSFAPTVADWQLENPMFREAIRMFITPMISSLSIMSLSNGGSEAEVLGLGISVIALNLGMYVAAPALVGFKVRKHIKSRKI